MTNNVDFITSLQRSNDFEELIRRVVKHIYSAEAYIVNGPYDGGRDLIYKRLGKEVREPIQISIQEKKLDEKILEDVEKIHTLATKLDYPSVLTFFSSQKITASRKAKLKKNSRDLFGVSLEIYDATEIEQIISEDAPEILEFLIADLHGYTKKADSIDAKARAFYDYLALSKDSAHLKWSIMDAQILSFLFENPHSLDEVLSEMNNNGLAEGVVRARISHLLGQQKIIEDPVGGLISLSSKENSRIDNILLKDEKARQELIANLKKCTENICGVDLSTETLELVKQVYSASIDLQLSELTFDPPRLVQLKDLVKKIEFLLINKGGLALESAHKAAKDLIEVSAKNEYLSNQCSSLLCLNLLKQRRLEKYIGERNFFVYLDAPVFIRHLALNNFKKRDYIDKEMRMTRTLSESLRALTHCRVAVTNEHLEETVRHITQAQKISNFANDELIQKFGESKNVYFNLYLAEKSIRRNYTFNNFLDNLIGFDNSTQNHSFDSYRSCVIRVCKISGIEIERLNIDIEDDSIAKRIVYYYDSWAASKDKQRKLRTVWNDLTACYVLADDSRHLDKDGYGHVPILITWDVTQHKLRELFRSEFPYAEWMIYSPQRAIERLSMVNFDASSLAMKDSVLAILDEDYTKESSLIDVLSGFFGNDTLETESIISVLSKVSGRLHNESHEAQDFELNERSVISEALLTIQNSFRDKFADVRRLFADSEKEDLIVEILSNFSSEKINREQLTTAFNDLLNSLRHDAQA